MCDQTEVIYAPGDVVWVKLGAGVWWPSQVQDYDQLPQDITGNLRKRPIAVVKFFQEDAFEYVKNLDQIYHYNCRKKHEFIKKGLDMCRSSNRNVPSNMKMFPNDIATAEHLTHGDPNILDSPEFQPEQKEDYRELFGGKKPASAKKTSRQEWRIRSLGGGGGESPTNGRRQSGTTTPRHGAHRQSGTTPRPVTHPRFINKALGRGSDHEVRIRSQSDQRLLQSSGKLYNCHLCGFSASRINVIILHNKSHSAGYADAFLPSLPGGKKAKKRSMSEKRLNASLPVDGSPPVKRKAAESDDLKSSGSPAGKNAPSASPVKKPIFGRKRSAKDKADKAAKEKRQTEEFRDKLLKDWDDDDNEEDEGDNSIGSSKGKGADDPAPAVEQESSTKLDDSKSTPSKETSCFDFDDSEDGIKPEETIMQFGRKIPRLLGDRKKRTEDVEGKEVERDGEMTRMEVQVKEEPLSQPEESEEERKSREEEERKRKEEKDKKAKEEFDKAFRALLEETVAPVIPDEAFNSNDKTLVNTCEAEDDGNIAPDPPEDVFNAIEEVECVETTKVDQQHFLVKASGEEAATSPDKQTSETSITPCDADNVANTSVNHAENDAKSTPSKETSCFEAIVEEVVEQTPESEEVVDFKIDETIVTTERESVLPDEHPTDSPKSRGFLSTTERGSVLPEDHPTDSPKSQGFLSNDFVDDCIIDNYSSKEKSQQSSSLIEIVDQPKSISSESGLTGEMQFIVVTSNADTSKTVSDANNMYQEMDFDIDSMPVIIGDDLNQDDPQLQQAPVLKAVEPPQNVLQNHHHHQFPLIKPKPSPKKVENKVVTVITSSGQLSKMNQSELKPVTKTAVVKKNQPTLVRIPTSTNNKITRKVILSPTKKSNSPTAIRIAAASSSQVGKLTSPLGQVGGKLKSPLAGGKLTMPGLLTQKVSSVSTAGKLSISPKGIVQSTAGSGQVLILKSTTPPGTASKTSLQKMIQPAGGNKVLILTSAQGGASGQKVLGTLAPQSKTITGTRFLTTKGSVVVGKGAGNTSQKILIDKSGAISQAPKSVIIDKSSLSATFSKSNTTLLTSSSDSMSSKLTLGTSKASSTFPISGNKGVILTPIASKGDSSKLRLLASKTSGSASSTTGAKLVLSTLPSKSQPLKLITKGQPNSSSTILIQTNQGVLATSSFPGTIQNQTKAGTAFIAAASKAQILHSSSINNMLQTQNKKLVIPKKSASPNILQKTQKKPVQRVTKKNFITNSTSVLTAAQPSTSSPITTTAVSAAQDMLLLPSMKNMPQGTILQGTTVDSEGRKSYVYLTVDEHGNYRPLESSPLLDLAAASTSESEASPLITQTSTSQLPSQQTVYYDPGNADLDNLLLAIDEAGNVVNVVPPQTDSGHSGYGQDILAKALADTQVLQPETTATDLGCVLVESLPPAPTLSHNVLETSSTLNQAPIMTPLEMPSAVSSLQIQSKFLKNNASMPLLSEDSAKPPSEAMFVATSDAGSSGNQLAFQLSIGADNNIIVTSSAADISTSLAAFMSQSQPAATETTILSNLAATSNKTVEETADNIIVTSSAADISTSLATFMLQPAATETTILSDPATSTSNNVEQGALAAFMCQPAATETTILSDAAATSSNNVEQLAAFMCQPATETTILSDPAVATSSNNEEQLAAFMSQPAATEATILSDPAVATTSDNEEQLAAFMSQPAATETTILSDAASSNNVEQEALAAFMSQPAATETTILSDAASSNNVEQEALAAFMSQPAATETTILSDAAATSSNNEEQLAAFMSQPAATETTILSDAASSNNVEQEALAAFMSQPAATETTILSDAAATSSNNEEQLAAFMSQPAATETTILSDDVASTNEEQGLTAAVKQLVTDSSADAFATFQLTDEVSKKDDYSETTMDSAASSCGKSELSTFNIEETSASSSFDLNGTKVASSEDDLFNQHTSDEQR